MQKPLFTIGQNFELGKPASAEIPAYKFRKIGILPKLLISVMESPNFMEMIYLQYSFNQCTFWDISLKK